MDVERVVVSAGRNLAGLNLLKVLAERKVSVVVLVHNREEEKQVEEIGGQTLSCWHSSMDGTQRLPDFEVKQAIIFESNLPQCCGDIQLFRCWCPECLYVISGGKAPVSIVYKGLGANYVIRSRSTDVSFLLHK